MDDYPGNSRKQQAPATDVPEAKKVERITSGEVVRRKKPLHKRFAETFVGGDAKTAWAYVAFDVLIPAFKDMVADSFTQGVERMLFGDSRSTSRRTGSRPGYSGGYVSYNRPSNTPRDGRREDPRGVSRRSRATHNFDEIILASRPEAEEVIDRLFDLVSRYEMATVSDLYELVGEQGKYTDEKWGWTDIRGAGVTRVRNGYLLDLPKPEPLD